MITWTAAPLSTSACITLGPLLAATGVPGERNHLTAIHAFSLIGTLGLALGTVTRPIHLFPRGPGAARTAVTKSTGRPSEYGASEGK